jgi:hypothetical protein
MTPSKCKYRAATLNEVAASISGGKQGNKPPDSVKRVPHNGETVSPKLRNWFPKTANNRPSSKRQPERSMPTGNCSRPDDANWIGAEIKSCCRLASLLDVPMIQAAQNVVPVAVTAADKIEGVRQWASGRCLSADRAGVYSRSEVGSGGRVRRVVRAG